MGDNTNFNVFHECITIAAIKLATIFFPWYKIMLILHVEVEDNRMKHQILSNKLLNWH